MRNDCRGPLFGSVTIAALRSRRKLPRSRASPSRPGVAPSRRRSARPGSTSSRRSSASPSRRTPPPASPTSARRSPPAGRHGIFSTQGAHTCGILEKEGKLEKLDPAIVNDAGVPKDLKTDYWISQIVYSIAIGWRTKAFGDKKPTGWAAFWDTKNFPGQRSMRRHPIYNLEAALITDGVPMDKLYPLDVDRAFKKLEELKPHVLVWWNSGAQSAQILQDGEVDMVGAWNGRIQAAMKETDAKGGPLAITFDQQMLVSDCWLIPKGAPNKDLAMKAIAIMMRPEVKARISLYINYAPANLAGSRPASSRRSCAAQLPNSPENIKKGSR